MPIEPKNMTSRIILRDGAAILYRIVFVSLFVLSSIHYFFQFHYDKHLTFRQNFVDGWEREGASLTVYHHGKKVVDLWGGYADRASLRKWKEVIYALEAFIIKYIIKTFLILIQNFFMIVVL